ncbi:hypothetical protein CAMSH0001_2049 [Campylobacter showae RM3277]|uniref:Uncharacterized protein n=1 Tax=Campylobacter showae RM3277 TaxID=553219 RepID=C6REF7_9BACT|nr:hypothetical protein CAMSH0001_2049 [Campylobacter showae RM3277]
MIRGNLVTHPHPPKPLAYVIVKLLHFYPLNLGNCSVKFNLVLDIIAQI